MKLQMFILLLCLGTASRAQVHVSDADLPDTSALRRQGVDTIGIYSLAYSSGYFFKKFASEYNSSYFESKVTFWRKNGKDFFYYTNKNVYYPVHEFSGSPVWDFYKTHGMVIDTEAFHTPLLKFVNLETEEIKIYAPRTRMGEARKIELNIKGRKVVKKFNRDEFSPFGFSGEENLSYSYNFHTETAQFQRLIDNLFLVILTDQRAIKKD